MAIGQRGSVRVEPFSGTGRLTATFHVIYRRVAPTILCQGHG